MSEAIAHFHLLRPWWLLMLVPVALLLTVLARRRDPGSPWVALCDAELLPHLLVGSGQHSGVRLVLLGCGALLAVLALAGPTWQRQPQPLYRDKTARVYVLDLSRSMYAQDVSPSRIDVARRKLRQMLDAGRVGRTALVAYSGAAFVVVPFSHDPGTAAALVPALSPQVMPIHGDNAAAGLRMAGRLLSRSNIRSAQILLLADGLGNAVAARRVARELRARGWPVSVLGIGRRKTASHALSGPGATLAPPFDAGPLRELARAGGGHYATIAGGDQDIRAFMNPPTQHALATSGPKTPQRGHEPTRSEHSDRWRDEGPWLLLPLLALAALAFRRGCLAAVVLATSLMPSPGPTSGWTSLWLRPDQIAARMLAAGRPAAAAHEFRDPDWRGIAWFRAGHYGKAAAAFAQASTPSARYNLGNALVHLGRLREALAAYDAALKANPHDADARHNRNLVLRWLLAQERSRGEPAPEGSRAHRQSGGAARGGHGAGTGAYSGSLSGSAGRGSEQTLNKWLRKIPDDPGGLLRRKFVYELAKRRQEGETSGPK